MKRILSMIICLVMIASMFTFALPVSAATYSGSCGASGSNVKWALDTSTGKLTISGTGVMAFYSSSSNVPWNSYCSSIKSLEIKTGVTSIGSSAFEGCTSLASIEIPDSVTSIGGFAFRDCTSLTSIDIPDSVTRIGVAAFYGCTSLTSIDIPDSVTSIGISAFDGCTSLTSIEIPDSVTSIGNYAFLGCKSLTSIEIPDSVTSIGLRAFEDCTSLTSIEIPQSVTSIGNSAFYGCKSLTSIEIPDSVTSIGNSAFSGCTSLTSIEIPDSVTSIGNSAFYGCTSLASIDIPDSVASIGSGAFSRCTSLTSIEIPDSVTSIGDDAFYACTSLASIELGDSVTSIGNSAFDGCTSLTSIEIPDSVTIIGEWAFYGCNRLTSIEIPDSVTSIGNYAFSGCKSLKKVTINSSTIAAGLTDSESCGDLIFYADTICLKNTISNVSNYVKNNYKHKSKDGDYIVYSKLYIHSYSEWQKHSSTQHKKVCECGDVQYEAHKWNSGVITKEPTHLELGEKLFTCTECGETYNEQIDKLTEHTYGEWKIYNEDQHNKICECGDIVYESHVYSDTDDADCNECGFVRYYTVGDFVFYIKTDGAYLYRYDGSSPTVMLPENYNGQSYKIHSKAFYNRTDIKSVIISSGVLAINSDAFYGCENLKKVINLSDNNITKGSTSNGYVAYYAIVVIKPTSEMVNENGYLFYTADDGTEYIIGYVGESTELNPPCTFKDSDYKIHPYAFCDRDDLTVVTIPEGITEIGTDAFAQMKGLKKVVFNAINCLDMTKSPFANSESESFDVEFGPKVSRIPAYLFAECNVASVDTSKNLICSNIGSYAFHNCTDLDSIILQNSVKTIGSYAFEGCSNLKSVTLGKNLNSIGTKAFYGCQYLFEVVNNSSLNIVCGSNSYGYVAYYAIEVHIAESLIDTVNGFRFYSTKDVNYLIDRVENTSELVMPESYKGKEYVMYKTPFKNNDVIESLVLGEGMINIPANAFYGCDNLSSVFIPDSVKSIGASAFSGCKSLKTVYIRSNAIAKLLSEFSACGELIANAETIAVDVSVTELDLFVSVIFDKHEKVEFGGNEYILYSKKAHNWEKYTAEGTCFSEGVDGYKCSTCGVVKGSLTGYGHVYDGEGDAECNKCGFTQYTAGDIDGTEGITKDDAIYLLMYTFFPEDYPVSQPLDFNGDGAVNKDDAIYLLMYTFFPEDYPIAA